jgi:hypothetical protein
MNEDQVSPPPAHEHLCFAWWNTGLVPPMRRAEPPDDKAVILATNVIRQMFDHERIDLLALSEVTPEIVERLRVSCQSRDTLRLIVDDRPPPTGRHLGVLYNSERILLTEEKKLGEMWDGSYLSGGLRLSLVVHPHPHPIHVFAIHWPSRMAADNEWKRRRLGANLQTDVEAVGGAVVVLGDFNDEPFGEALHSALLGTRDRDLARSNSSRLYNPFWRYLGERQSIERETEGRLPAGTYFYRTKATNWHTFDQALISGSLLSGPGWVLREETSGIWQRSPLLTAKGRIASGFDHFPIYVRFSIKT